MILKKPIFWLAMIISVSSIVVAFSLSGLDALLASIGKVEADMVFWCVVATFIHFLIRNKRWQITIEQKCSYLGCLWAQGIGFLFIFLLPLRLGDPVRIFTLAKLENISLLNIGASVIFERLVDIFMALSLLLAVTAYLGQELEITRLASILSALLFLGLAVVTCLLLMVARLQSSSRIIQLLNRLSKVTLASIKHYGKSRVAKSIIFWTLAGWLIGVARHWFGIAAFVPDVNLIEATLLTVMLALAVAIPSAPGFIGVFQIVGQQALILPFADKYDAATALSITIILHLVLFAVCMLTGIVSAIQVGKKLQLLAFLRNMYDKAAGRQKNSNID